MLDFLGGQALGNYLVLGAGIHGPSTTYEGISSQGEEMVLLTLRHPLLSLLFIFVSPST